MVAVYTSRVCYKISIPPRKARMKVRCCFHPSSTNLYRKDLSYLNNGDDVLESEGECEEVIPETSNENYYNDNGAAQTPIVLEREDEICGKNERQHLGTV